MLAFIDYSIPKFTNERTVVLAVVFSIMAFFVSPLSPLDQRKRERATALYLPAILIWWYFFQFMCLSLTPGIHYYWGPASRFTWLMNSGVCSAFGFAFSLRLLRLSRGKFRIEGIIFAVIFLLLIFLVANGNAPLSKT